ncbi:MULTISPECIES: Hsp20 family protein [unclassified Pseudodesulfovibrio]|nr:MULTISPECIES: Hsp20 family protein [unclassified Pseudodesulfovibrio]MCJ2165278.1 hypothetical protein [Pseudodesulfovibrio sp. S3-i]
MTVSKLNPWNWFKREQVNAKLNKGVLCISMPRIKRAESESRKIAIGT